MEIRAANSVNIFAVLPEGVLLHVFDNLRIPDILRCSRVCKTWNRACQSERLWRAERGLERVRLKKLHAKTVEIETKRRYEKEEGEKLTKRYKRIITPLHTPFHDAIFTLCILLCLILCSIRLDGEISTKISYLLIPGIFGLIGFLIKAISIAYFHYIRDLYLNLNIGRAMDCIYFLSTFIAEDIKYQVPFHLANALLVCFLVIIQTEIESTPKYISILPLFIEIVLIAFGMVSAKSNFKFGGAISLGSIFVFGVLTCLQLSILHWYWRIIHSPMWFLYGFTLVYFISYSCVYTYGRIIRRLCFGILAWVAIIGPFLVTSVLLVCRLDGVRKVPYWGIFIPLELVLCCVLLGNIVGVIRYVQCEWIIGQSSGGRIRAYLGVP